MTEAEAFAELEEALSDTAPATQSAVEMADAMLAHSEFLADSVARETLVDCLNAALQSQPAQPATPDQDAVNGCSIGSCHRHGKCMYLPCRRYAQQPAPDGDALTELEIAAAPYIFLCKEPKDGWRGQTHVTGVHLYIPQLERLRDAVAATTAERAKIADLVEAARTLITQKFDTMNIGKGIEADDGEKCWIVHSDDIFGLEAALAALDEQEAGQ